MKLSSLSYAVSADVVKFFSWFFQILPDFLENLPYAAAGRGLRWTS
jgi:hypothetical protein